MPAESGSRLSARCGAAAVSVNILPGLQTAENCVLKQCRQPWKTFPFYFAHACDLDCFDDSLSWLQSCCYQLIVLWVHLELLIKAQAAQHQAAVSAAAKVVPASGAFQI